VEIKRRRGRKPNQFWNQVANKELNEYRHQQQQQQEKQKQQQQSGKDVPMAGSSASGSTTRAGVNKIRAMCSSDPYDPYEWSEAFDEGDQKAMKSTLK